MPVLGKRTRSSTEQDRTERPKRKALTQNSFVIVSDDDEEEDPFNTPRKSKRQRTGKPKYLEADDLDDLAVENTPPVKEKVHFNPNAIPTTPRHRDNLSKKIAITPRHRVGLLSSRPQTPQTLRTPTTPRAHYPSVYNEARKLFKATVQSNKIIGRENEKADINTFVETRFKAKSSGCIYVSGPPGTGKSALINEICDQLKESYPVQSSYCNCMSIKTAADVYAAILNEFGITDVMVGTELTHLKKLFHSKTESHLVILDEIDHLLEVDINLLYQLFEWSSQKSSNLVLIGIANALDLTDRFLPRLKSKNMRPKLIPFMPYSVTEITNIVSTTLRSLLPETTETPDYTPLIHPTAIMFLAKKVAAQTGDIRKAFAVSIRALDLIESETVASLLEITPSSSPSPTKTPLRENLFLSSPNAARSPRKIGQNPLANLKVETAPRATIAHVARVTAAVFGNGLTQRLANLNLQQKAALCALAALEGFVRDAAAVSEPMMMTPSKTPSRVMKAAAAQAKNVTIAKAPTMRALHEVYVRLVKRESALAPLTATEFGDVLAGLETMGLVNSVGGSIAVTPSKKRGRIGNGLVGDGEGARVSSCASVNELKTALKGIGSGILMGILEGDAV
jgi:cell division control protein 6